MHSLVVQTKLSELAEFFDAVVDHKSFADLFKSRLSEKSIKLNRGLEYNYTIFSNGDRDKKIGELIKKHHEKTTKEEKLELKKQKERLKKAKDKLKKKKTKTAELEASRAQTKIEKLEWKLKRKESVEPKPYDSRIYPFYFAPILVMEQGKRTIRASRFHCRPHGQHPSFDRKSYSMYKARIESLTDEYFERIRYHSDKPSLWEPLFGSQHGVLLVSRFYENVPLHLHEGRELKKGEKEKNIVVGFEPKDVEWQLMPCIYDRWQSNDKKQHLHSFALITGEAPPDVVAAGYHRCPIFLRRENLDVWLSPEGRSNHELHSLLTPEEPIAYKAIA